MNLSLHARKGFKLTPEIESWAEKRYAKFDKFFKEDATAKIFFSEEKGGKTRVESTITASTILYRAETSHEDPLVAIDVSERIITRQLMKHKTRISKSLRDPAAHLAIAESFDETAPEEEHEFNVVRNKKFDIKPMHIEEAILQMNLLGHSFFLFKEAETMKTNLVYKRNAGDYGLIEI